MVGRIALSCCNDNRGDTRRCVGSILPSLKYRQKFKSQPCHSLSRAGDKRQAAEAGDGLLFNACAARRRAIAGRSA